MYVRKESKTNLRKIQQIWYSDILYVIIYDINYKVRG